MSGVACVCEWFVCCGLIHVHQHLSSHAHTYDRPGFDSTSPARLSSRRVRHLAEKRSWLIIIQNSLRWGFIAEAFVS